VQGSLPAEKAETANNNSVSTNPFVSDLTDGNLLVVWIFYNSSTESVVDPGGVTDTAGNIYVKAIGPATGAGTLSAFRQEIWYAQITKAGNPTVTAAFTGTFNGEKAISPHEYHPDNPVTATLPGALDKIGFSSSPATDTLVNLPLDSLVFGAAIFFNSGTFGPGFVQRSNLRGNVAEDLTAQKDSAQATFLGLPPGLNQDWIAQVVVFSGD